MINFKSTKDKKAALKTLAGVSVNLCATWFAAAFITPNFANITSLDGFLILTVDVIFGIFFLVITFYFERKIE